MDRPTGVTVLSILGFAAAAMFLMIATGAFTGGAVFLAASGEMRGQLGWGTFLLIGVACLLLAGLVLAVGIGFWKLLNWSRILQIALLILFLAFQVLAVIGGMLHFRTSRVVFRAVILALEMWVLAYLFRTDVKQAFRKDAVQRPA